MHHRTGTHQNGTRMEDWLRVVLPTQNRIIIMIMKWTICMLFFFLANTIDLALATTNVKWTAGDTNGHAAATAPRSQKYWNDHNIERPDYAKTDAEIAMERGGASGGSSLVHTSIVTLMMMMTVCCVLGYRYYFDVWPRLPQEMGGHKLGPSSNTDADAAAAGRWFLFGGSRTSTTNQYSQEATRQARLSRLERKTD
jgi:hypothetical protein